MILIVTGQVSSNAIGGIIEQAAHETERELRVPMSEQMHSEIANLNSQIESLDDPRQCYALVKERIHQYRSSGANVPEDLARMERNLLTECLCASQGR